MSIKIHLSGQLVKRIVLLALFAVLAYFIFQAVRSFGMEYRSGNAAGAVFGFLQFVFLLFCAALPLAFLVVPAVMSRAIDSLLGLNQEISEPVELLSPIQGLIRSGHFEPALEKLDELLEKNPRSRSGNFILAKLFFLELQRPLDGMAVVERYFAPEAPVEPAEENVEILLLYCEACESCDCREQAAQLLERELRRAYASPERRLLQQRLAGLRQ